jgi:hypothetical protein
MMVKSTKVSQNEKRREGFKVRRISPEVGMEIATGCSAFSLSGAVRK